MRTTVIILACLMLCGCALFRTEIAQPTLKEEVAWNKMLHSWATKAYSDKDFRAGFLVASTKPYMAQMPVVMSTIVADIAAQGDPKTEGWKQGTFGGLTLSFYAVSMGQGVRWLMEQLFNLGVIPLNLSGFLV